MLSGCAATQKRVALGRCISMDRTFNLHHKFAMLLDVLHVLPPRATAVVFTAAAALLGALVGAVATHHHHWRRRGKAREAADAVRASSILPSPIALIGDTPMVALPRLSAALRCHIFAKCEFLNPGGSPKDRVARAIIEDAERAGLIRPHAGYTIYEGTVGSTGIALAWVCRARGYRCYIVMPDDQAREKYELLERLGAVVERVRPASIVDRQQFCNVARVSTMRA